jgi:hypothetical protein
MLKDRERDLFGEQRILIDNPSAYAGAPGSGPRGKTCRQCAQYVITGRAKKHRKCGLINWTNGAATDIKAKTPACNHYSVIIVNN